jgi:signal transduction histidine kinase
MLQLGALYTPASNFLLGLLLGIAGSSAYYVVLHRRRIRHGTTVAVANERRRIARELHDSVGHGLVVIAMNARRLPGISDRARPVAMAIEDAVQQTIGETRRLIGGLREDGESSTEEGHELLSVSLKQLCARFGSPGIALSLKNTQAERFVPPHLRRTIFRIVQECITNALKHGHTSVRVLLEFSGEVTLCIADGPCSRDIERACRQPLGQNSASGGYGLIGLCERVSEAGGSIEYGRPPRGGFVVRARIPLTALTDGERDSHGWDTRSCGGRSAAR